MINMKLSLVNETRDGVIRTQTTSQAVVDFLLAKGYHVATSQECRRAMRRQRKADRQAALNWA